MSAISRSNLSNKQTQVSARNRQSTLRNRQGLGHISRFVDLLLAHYGLDEDEAYENDFLSSETAPSSSNSPSNINPNANKIPSLPVGGGVQNTFAFYQGMDDVAMQT